MINHIKIWSNKGSEIATFIGDSSDRDMSNTTINDTKALVYNLNRKGSICSHFGESLVISIPDSEIGQTMEKLTSLFKSFKKITH
jgi:hypothetical protein